MYPFENKHKKHDLILAFNEIDQKRALFNEEFIARITSILSSSSFSYKHIKSVNEVFKNYAFLIQDITQSVIDKDRNYPVYRLEEELTKITKLAAHPNPTNITPNLHNLLLKEVKALMVDSNKDVFNLTGLGFRLLDANAKVFLSGFLNALLQQ